MSFSNHPPPLFLSPLLLYYTSAVLGDDLICSSCCHKLTSARPRIKIDVFIFRNALRQINVYEVTPWFSFYEDLETENQFYHQRQIINSIQRFGAEKNTGPHALVIVLAVIAQELDWKNRIILLFRWLQHPKIKFWWALCFHLLLVADDPLTVIITLRRNYSPARGDA